MMNRSQWFLLLALVVFWTVLIGLIVLVVSGSFYTGFLWAAIVGAGSFLLGLIVFCILINGNSIFN
jgi:hypothetical protein